MTRRRVLGAGQSMKGMRAENATAAVRAPADDVHAVSDVEVITHPRHGKMASAFCQTVGYTRNLADAPSCRRTLGGSRYRLRQLRSDHARRQDDMGWTFGDLTERAPVRARHRYRWTAAQSQAASRDVSNRQCHSLPSAYWATPLARRRSRVVVPCVARSRERGSPG